MLHRRAWIQASTFMVAFYARPGLFAENSFEPLR